MTIDAPAYYGYSSRLARFRQGSRSLASPNLDSWSSFLTWNESPLAKPPRQNHWNFCTIFLIHLDDPSSARTYPLRPARSLAKNRGNHSPEFGLAARQQASRASHWRS